MRDTTETKIAALALDALRALDAAEARCLAMERAMTATAGQLRDKADDTPDHYIALVLRELADDLERARCEP